MAQDPSRRRLAQPLRSGAFGTAAPCGPFSDDANTAAKAGCFLKPPPQLGTVAAAGRPFGIEPGEVRLKKHSTGCGTHRPRRPAQYRAPAFGCDRSDARSP